MQNPPKTGTTHTKTLTVLDKHAVDFAIPDQRRLAFPSVNAWLWNTVGC